MKKISMKRTLPLVFSISMILIGIIILKYDMYEQRILSFKIITSFLICYMLLYEFPYIALYEIRSSLKKLNKIIIIGFYMFGLLLGVLTAVEFVNLFADSFIISYQSKEITVLSSESRYRDMKSVLVIIDDEFMKFSLAPGYVQVEDNSKYLAHVFVKSKIIIPVEGPLK
jgi:hypothetical protein